MSSDIDGLLGTRNGILSAGMGNLYTGSLHCQQSVT